MRNPDLEQKLDILISLATDDREGLPPRLRHTKDVGALRPLNIRTLRPAPGMKMSLLRILMTNACSYNCHYCPMRRDRPMPRTLLKPEELVRIFLGAHQRGWCQGLFITTGIPGRPVKVMDDLVQVLELLRERHRFGGYIHVKLVAGSETAQIDRLTALASRVSLNFEAPCGKSLAQIAPDKSFSTTLHDFERVRSLVVLEREARAHGRPRDPLHPNGASGMTMQFVVGATPDTDRSLLGTISRLTAAGGVHHPQFSAFRPISDTPMENVAATPALREHRLYQAAHLLDGYGFRPEEVVYAPDGNLPLALDPKSAWALAHPELFPVEVQSASYEELVRVPGIGPVAARRLVDQRATVSLRGLSDLRKLGVLTIRAGGFLTLRGRRLQTTRWTEQLGFWAPEDDVGTHHVVYQVSPGTFR
ncbi:MAG: putative DNA modification/repair radical SAM protein [Gemmatimonadales bacterium]|nr:putative DNA modification/repair radical SAM protein [Gemmatimonadales bacterium]